MISGVIPLIIILAIGLLLLAVVSAGKGSRSRNGHSRSRSGGRGRKITVRDEWATIEQLSLSGPTGLKNAISEADKLFNHVMSVQGYPGETMADRLKVAQAKLSDKNSVWQAHKLRNALAHEIGFDFIPSQAKIAIASFKRGLKDLGAL